ncbi:MAG: carboxypeptidase-like regulatory domain-containing protein [Flavobacteriales bacterium]|nr:carboxypeptidase-like regulatory domain-containing protein [Flavobacteriales bacterium]
MSRVPHCRSRFRLRFVLLSFLFAGSAVAQTTRVTGITIDARTKEPLPFVTVGFVNSRIGTTSDAQGHFALETYYPTDSVRASSLGFEAVTKAVRKDRDQRIDLALEPLVASFQEVVIRRQDRNPAFEILDRVVANKPTNNREKLSAYSFDAYNKIEFDINNLSRKFVNNKLWKPFRFVFDNMDSTDVKPYLPIFISESLSEIHYRQKPRSKREVIRGTRQSGIQNQSISQLLGDMYQNVNVYDNFLVLFGKNFISPIADGGRLFYDYYLTDSAWVGSNWCYHLEFHPKRKNELAFDGEMWIADTAYAVKRIQAGFPQAINLNFVQGFWVDQEYEPVQPEVWMLVRDHLVVDLGVFRRKLQGFYGRRTALYKEFKINSPIDTVVFEGAEVVRIERDSASTTDDYWDFGRHEPLNQQEANIYEMIDSVQKVPRFRTFVDIVNMLATGYLPIGPLEYGPYYTIYSFNQVEGTRLRFGLRTSNDWSRRTELEGYAAYGLLDHELKGMIGGQTFITKEPRQLTGLYLRHDIEQLGQSQSAFRSDNVLSSTFRRNPANKLTLVDEVRYFYELEPFTGLNNQFTIRYRNLQPRGDLVYLRPSFADGFSTVEVSHITSLELSLNTRFAWGEKYISGEFRRFNLGTFKPVLEIYGAAGIPTLLGSDYEYYKLIGRVDQRVQMGALGYLRYRVEAGRIWGTLPYPLLILHTGNETFYYYDDAFNTMNFFEFISDRYASIRMDHHFDGLFFNRVPLLRKLKLREVIGAKAVIGDLDPKHSEEVLFLPGMYRLYDGPFVEASAGIENILNVLRIDGVWRLTYQDHPNISLFALRLKFRFDF